MIIISIQNKVKNQKGSVMLTVIVVLAILVIIGIALLDSSTLGFKLIKHDEKSEIAYSAAQSAIEECFAFIDNYCAMQSNTNGIEFNNEEEFAEHLINWRIIPALKADTFSKYGIEAEKVIYKIGLSSNASDEATVEIPESEIKYLSWKEFPGDNSKIIITIGITAKADYAGAGDKVSNKAVFSKKEVVIFIPKGFKLNAAIYTIGDLMIDDINAQVTGDVVAFGTAPQYAQQIEQYYYGGIYAKNSGHLSVAGNAYSRGLIRTGDYFNSMEDPSSIYIYKDAISNGIHIFGKGQKIVVGRNAYTFDDLEMNGEDSIIAINGSYLGLTNDKGAVAHDQSSAIVNSAIVHHSASDASMKSRIVINEDIIVNGGTFKVDPDTGDVSPPLVQIEDASVVASDSISSPMYKEYMDEPEYGNDDFMTYHEWLYKKRNYATGFANLLQCWNRQSFSDDISIKTWTDLIDNARGVGINNSGYFDTGIDTSSISGFCHYELGANGRVYFMDPKSYNSADNTIEIDSLKFINTGFTIDNVDKDAGYWNGFWNGLPGPSNWRELAAADETIADKLKEIKNFLLPLTEIFSLRSYDYADKKIKNTLRGASNGSSSENLFLDIKDKLIAKYPSGNPDIDKYIFEFSGEAGNQIIDINTKLTERIVSNPELSISDNYFLFINPDPSIVLKINGKVNGIIFSLGRVEIENGAEVTGAIIAAGNGYTSDGNYVLTDKSSADQHTDSVSGEVSYYLPQILEEGENLDKLEDGSYSGVYFRKAAGVLTAPATVVFPGRESLLLQFKNEGINLGTIF